MKSIQGLAIFIIMLFSLSSFAENWPQWRGPEMNGITTETNLPVEWGADKNIAWKTELPGIGQSTPIIWGNKVFLTFQMGSGPVAQSSYNPSAARGSDDEIFFFVRCFDKTNGNVLWEFKTKARGELESVHPLHNLATPSCVTDGERVIAWFGTGQLFCFDMDGKVIWKRHLGEEISPFRMMWGHSSSPALHKDLLYLPCDHDPAAYLLAVNKATGETVWKTDRGKGLRGYSTPLIIDTGEREELILNSNPRVDAYDSQTGKALWHAGGFMRTPVPMPVYANGVIYLNRGYRNSPYLAIKPGGSGDVNDSHVLWRMPNRAPYTSSFLYYEGQLYMATEEGNMYCVDPETGEPIGAMKFHSPFWASPAAGEGKIYYLPESGEALVFNAGEDMELIARNDLGERTMASPAFSDGKLFIRTDNHLFCIEQTEKSG